jgi:hypothetical protein
VRWERGGARGREEESREEGEARLPRPRPVRWEHRRAQRRSEREREEATGSRSGVEGRGLENVILFSLASEK